MAYSRYQEREADRFALELTRDNRSAASAFVTMQAENLGNPRPGRLSVLWRATHPPLGERIDFCNAYRPWLGGGRGVYEGLFRPDASRR
jgi:Zn-dependent protease with chaperone function